MGALRWSDQFVGGSWWSDDDEGLMRGGMRLGGAMGKLFLFPSASRCVM